MTNAKQIMDGFLAVMGLAAIVAYFYGPWQSMVIAAVRQRWFEIRDNAFDCAARGQLSFADPRYIEFRSLINALIGSAEHFSFWRVLAMALMRRDSEADERANAAERISVRSDDSGYLDKQEQSALWWFVLLLWLRSPFLIALTFCLFFIIPILLLVAAVSSEVRKSLGRLQAIATSEAALHAKAQ